MQNAVYEQFKTFSRFDFWHRVGGGDADEVLAEVQNKTVQVLKKIVEEHEHYGASPVRSLWEDGVPRSYITHDKCSK